jgi:hypothetical protein
LEKAEDWMLGRYPGMELVDARGECWTITSVETHGTIGSWLGRIFSKLLGSHVYRVTLGIEWTGSISFGALIERVIRSIQRYPNDWYDEEIGAGESGEPQEDYVQRAYLIARVRQARNTRDLCIILADPFASILSDV